MTLVYHTKRKKENDFRYSDFRDCLTVTRLRRSIVHKCTITHVNAYTNTDIGIQTETCVNAPTHTHKRRTQACTQVCPPAGPPKRAHTHTHIHTNPHTHTHTHTHMLTHTYNDCSRNVGTGINWVLINCLAELKR